MNLETIVTAVISSGVVGLLVGYILNRRLESARIQLEEAIRRRGALYDDQVKVFCDLLEMTYRIRNAAQTLASGQSSDGPALSAKSMRRLEEFHEALVELLYKQRGVIPPALFRFAHDLKSSTALLASIVDESRFDHAPGGRCSREAEQVAEVFRQIDSIYETMVPLVQAQVGVQGDET